MLLGSSLGGLRPQYAAPLVTQLEEIVDTTLQVTLMCVVRGGGMMGGWAGDGEARQRSHMSLRHSTHRCLPSLAANTNTLPPLPPLLLPPPPNNHQIPSRAAHNWSSMVLSSLLSVLTSFYFPHQAWSSSGGLLLPNGLQLFIDRKGVGWTPPQ